VDELDDNFVGVVRDETDPVLVETFHSISRLDSKPEPEVKPETTDSPVEEVGTTPEAPLESEAKCDSLVEEPETKSEAHLESDAKSETTESPVQETKSESFTELPVEEPETKSEAPLEVDEPKPESNSERSEEVESVESTPEVQLEEPETKNETNPDPISEPSQAAIPLTAEEVLNPIIEHILKGSTEPSQEPAKKKKRSRKK
jgi:hypothetical protein